jgi:hypothetical protein
MKKNTITRGTKKRPSPPSTTLLPVRPKETTKRLDPDPSDLALVDVDDPTPDESELLFRPRLRFVPE